MTNKFNAPRWNLESIFPGGSGSKEFSVFRTKLKNDLLDVQQSLAKFKGKTDTRSFEAWGKFILSMQKLYKQVYQASSFVECLISQDVNDSEGHKIDAEISTYGAQWSSSMTSFEEFAINVSDKQWEKFITIAKLGKIRFYLDLLRLRARSKMAPEFERLVLDLAVDGYHGWNRLYDKMAGDLRTEFGENGETRVISMGQLLPIPRRP